MIAQPHVDGITLERGVNLHRGECELGCSSGLINPTHVTDTRVSERHLVVTVFFATRRASLFRCGRCCARRRCALSAAGRARRTFLSASTGGGLFLSTRTPIRRVVVSGSRNRRGGTSDRLPQGSSIVRLVRLTGEKDSADAQTQGREARERSTTESHAEVSQMCAAQNRKRLLAGGPP